MLFQRKPIEPRTVEAWHWKGQPQSEWPEWLGPPCVMLPNLEIGQWWFIRQPHADRALAYPARDFERDYEPAIRAVA